MMRTPREEKIRDWRKNRRPNKRMNAQPFRHIVVLCEMGHKLTMRGIKLLDGVPSCSVCDVPVKPREYNKFLTLHPFA